MNREIAEGSAQTEPYISESGRVKFEVHWHVYQGKKSVKFKTPAGKEVVLKPGDVYGAQEYSKTHDIISFPDTKWRFKLEIDKSEKLMERSKEKKSIKVKVKPEPKAKPAAKPDEPKVKVVKPVDKQATKVTKIKKPVKVTIKPKADEDDDAALDKKYGVRIIEPLDEMDLIDDDEIRGILDSFSRVSTLKVPKV